MEAFAALVGALFPFAPMTPPPMVVVQPYVQVVDQFGRTYWVQPQPRVAQPVYQPQPQPYYPPQPFVQPRPQNC